MQGPLKGTAMPKQEVDEQGRPVMYCRKIGRKGAEQWVFHCPVCKREHWHSPEPGHRAPHCGDPGRRQFPRGYVLALAVKAPAKQRL